MKQFKSYLFGKFRSNNPHFKFNTLGLNYLNNTFFYLGSDGIYSYKTYKRIDKKDERAIIYYLRQNRAKILRNYEDTIESEIISRTAIRVNTFIYPERSHVRAIKRYLKDR